MLENFDPASIHDEALRGVVLLLMNEIERLSTEVKDLKDENQQLRDENRRLKGEQGKPVTALPSLSSEKERHIARPYHKSAKQGQVTSDRQERSAARRSAGVAARRPVQRRRGRDRPRCLLSDRQRALPQRDVLFAERETDYLAAMPAGYDGQFGPSVIA